MMEYEWLSSSCRHCKVFGHKTTDCEPGPGNVRVNIDSGEGVQVNSPTVQEPVEENVASDSHPL